MNAIGGTIQTGDYSNRTCLFFLSLSFSFHFHFNFRLNQLNKDQSHQKDFNNIRQTDKKLTQNEVSIEQIEYFFGLNLFRRFFLLSLSENQKERAKYTNKKRKITRTHTQ